MITSDRIPFEAGYKAPNAKTVEATPPRRRRPAASHPPISSASSMCIRHCSWSKLDCQHSRQGQYAGQVFRVPGKSKLQGRANSKNAGSYYCSNTGSRRTGANEKIQNYETRKNRRTLADDDRSNRAATYQCINKRKPKGGERSWRRKMI